MYRAILFFIVLSAIGIKGYSQITKENWMLGGNAGFSVVRERGSALDANATNFRISPNIGYFFIDKLAIGINADYAYYNQATQWYTQASNQISGGPFVRYYFLRPENLLNVFAQGSYQYVYYWSNNQTNLKRNDINLTGGASVFLNTSVGLEFMASYQLLNGPMVHSSAQLSLGIGFQIYIGKEKN